MSDDARYRAFPSISPYADDKRYALLKEDHKYFIQKLQETVDCSKELSFMDVGCGNGELIYQLSKVFPHWKYFGTDYTPEFIETAQRFPGLKGSEFVCCDFLETVGEYDIVFCSSVLQIFTDIKPYIAKLIEICRPGGFVFADGQFNKFDVEVRLQYCDGTNPDTAGKWRTDWNQYSRKMVREMVGTKASAVSFVDVPMNLDMPVNEQRPINRFTFRDFDGRNIITNGTNMILNRTLMVMQKA